MSLSYRVHFKCIYFSSHREGKCVTRSSTRLLHNLKTLSWNRLLPQNNLRCISLVLWTPLPVELLMGVWKSRISPEWLQCNVYKKYWLLLAISKKETILKWNCSDVSYSCLEKVMNLCRTFYNAFGLPRHIHFFKSQLLTKLWLAAVHLVTAG